MRLPLGVWCILATLLPRVALAQDMPVPLPVSWLDGQVRVTIAGVFLATPETFEGTIARDERQYKLLISYENTANVEYSAGSAKTPAGVGTVKLVTVTGNVYGPKYVGGGISYDLKPKQKYSTYLYSFNLAKDEQPSQLLIYREREALPRFRVSIGNLIPAPLPDYIRLVSVQDSITTEDFRIQLLDVTFPDKVIKGPFSGNRYGLYKPLQGKRFVCLRIAFTNLGKRASDGPLYSHDGDVEVEDTNGTLHPSIEWQLTYTSIDKRLIQGATPSDKVEYPELEAYATDVPPGAAATVVQVFEMGSEETPSVVRIKLLGDVRELRVRLRD